MTFFKPRKDAMISNGCSDYNENPKFDRGSGKVENFWRKYISKSNIFLTFQGNDFAAYLTEAMQRYKSDHGSVKNQAKALNTLFIHIFIYHTNSIRYEKPTNSNIWLEVVIRWPMQDKSLSALQLIHLEGL